MAGWCGGVKYFDMRRLPLFAANPDLLEQVIEANLVVCRNIAGAAVGGIDERAGEGMPRAVQRSVKLQVAVREFDSAIGLAGNVRVVGDHQNCVAGIVQLAENLQHDGFVDFIEIARGLVRKNQLGLIDERASDSHALLLAAGELRGKMCEAVTQAHAMERITG